MGILGSSCAAIMQHYLQLPDLVYGVFMGLSFGLIILSVVLPRIARPGC